MVPRQREHVPGRQAVLAGPGTGGADGHASGPTSTSSTCSVGGARVKIGAFAPVGDRPGRARRARAVAAAGPPPMPAVAPGTAARSRSNAPSTPTGWSASAAGRCWPPRSSPGGGSAIRFDGATLMSTTRTPASLLRTRPNPLTPEQASRLRGARPAGPPPMPSSDPGPGAAPGHRHRRHHGLPSEHRPRPRPRRRHRDRARRRGHPDRRSRRSDPRHPSDQQPGPSYTSRRTDPARSAPLSRETVSHQPVQKRRPSAGTRQTIVINVRYRLMLGTRVPGDG